MDVDVKMMMTKFKMILKGIKKQFNEKDKRVPHKTFRINAIRFALCVSQLKTKKKNKEFAGRHVMNLIQFMLTDEYKIQSWFFKVGYNPFFDKGEDFHTV